MILIQFDTKLKIYVEARKVYTWLIINGARKPRCLMESFEALLVWCILIFYQMRRLFFTRFTTIKRV